MFLKKGMCFFLFVTAVLLLATAPSPFQRDNLDKIRADGGQPPAPPIPWSSVGRVIEAPQLNADGGQPPAPPIPWPGGSGGSSALTADGGQPPAPPIPWGLVNVDLQSVTA